MTPAVSQIDIDLDITSFGPGADDVLTPKGPAINAFTPIGIANEVLDIPGVAREQEEETPVVKPEIQASIPDAQKPITAKNAEALGLDDIVNSFTPPTGELAEVESVEEQTTDSKVGRPKTDKNPIVNYIKDNIEKNGWAAFEDYDEKTPIEEYLNNLPEKELYQLLDSNREAEKQAIIDRTPQEFFEALSPELRYAAEYEAKGGKDVKGLFRALAQVEETRALDPANENDQISIARSYLQAKKFGTQEQIEAQVNEWKDDGKIEAKVKQFKPMLDQMQEQQVQYKLQQQEEYNKQQEQLAQYYTQNVLEALKPGDINGIKLDKKTQNILFTGLTTLQQSPISGKPVNLLGYHLEQIQYSENPDYKLLAEATYLLSDPEGYRNAIRQGAKNQIIEDKVKMLKTAQGANTATTTIPEASGDVKVKKMLKPKNVFER